MTLKTKSAVACACVFLLLSATGAAADSSDSGSGLGGAWKDFTEAGKSAVKEAGDFFSETGKKLGEDVSEAGKEIEKAVDDVAASKAAEKVAAGIVGKWEYDGGKSVTTFTIKDDGTMEVRQKEGFTSLFWRGTYSDSGSVLTFAYTEKGVKEFFSEKPETASGTWRIAYAFTDTGLWCSSPDIPKDSAGNGFADGRLFK